MPALFLDGDKEKERIAKAKEALINLECGEITYLDFCNYVRSLICQEDLNLMTSLRAFDLNKLLEL